MSDDYKTAQRSFFNWVTKWTQTGVIEDSPIPDVLDIITLLQAIGYKVKYFDPCLNSEDVLPVPGGGGIRMIITCTNSGLRACLELTSQCNCPKMNNSSVWEVTGSAPNTSQDMIHETGSDVLLPVAKGTKHVIKQVINHLFNLIKTDQNQNTTRTPNKYNDKLAHSVQTPGMTNESFKSCYSNSILSTNHTIVNDVCVNNYVTVRETEHKTPEKMDENERNLQFELANKPVIKVESPEPPMSPARYRSLDTLTSSMGRDELPEPGKLRKDLIECEPIPTMLHSSPDITGRMSQPSSTSSPNSHLKFDHTAFMKVKMANELLEEIIQSMNGPEFFEDISKIKESCESLSSFGSKFSCKSTKLPKMKMKSRFCSSPNLTKSSVFTKTKADMSKLQIKPQSRKPIRANSTSSVSQIQGRPSIRSSSVSENKFADPHRDSRKSDCMKEPYKPLPPIKNLYSNIKSTIPKPAKKTEPKK